MSLYRNLAARSYTILRPDAQGSAARKPAPDGIAARVRALRPEGVGVTRAARPRVGRGRAAQLFQTGGSEHG
jgi:hypothetical protein